MGENVIAHRHRLFAGILGMLAGWAGLAFLVISLAGHDGDRPGILASASLSHKASRREVGLDLPGVPEQVWQLDLGSDPDPITDYSPFKLVAAVLG